MVQPRVVCGRRRSPAALPRVETDVVMVSPGGNERHMVAQEHHTIEPEHSFVKGKARSMSDTFRWTWPIVVRQEPDISPSNDQSRC